MNKETTDLLEREWRDSVLPTLEAYVRIPNKSPAFDADWEAHGHMQRAIELFAHWARRQPIPGMSVEVRQLPGRTPLLLIDIPGERADCVLLYGHLDKQPEFTGWLPGLSPWEPVMRDGKLYGRGAADDGYALFSALTAIAAAQASGARLARCVVLIEACEESGSTDLPAHLEALGPRLGEPSLVICLDAECGNYEQLWCTTSLRGNLTGTLRVKVLTEGVHSGLATGIAATPFRIAMQLLARLEDPLTGEILLDSLRVSVPPQRRAQLAVVAGVLGSEIAGNIPFAEATRPLSEDPLELLLGNTWRATLAVTGAEGLPELRSAGNVLLPQIALKLSLRLPPSCDAGRVASEVRRLLERDPPYRASVQFAADEPASGWSAPETAAWLDASLQRASRDAFGRDALYSGCGGTIPFMSMLGQRFPRTQFFITGVLGPHANAHGPNEFLHVPYAKRLTACVAQVLADHAARG